MLHIAAIIHLQLDRAIRQKDLVVLRLSIHIYIMYDEFSRMYFCEALFWPLLSNNKKYTQRSLYGRISKGHP